MAVMVQSHYWGVRAVASYQPVQKQFCSEAPARPHQCKPTHIGPGASTELEPGEDPYPRKGMAGSHPVRKSPLNAQIPSRALSGLCLLFWTFLLQRLPAQEPSTLSTPRDFSLNTSSAVLCKGCLSPRSPLSPPPQQAEVGAAPHSQHSTSPAFSSPAL